MSSLRLFFIYLVTIVLFVIYANDRPNYRPSRISPLIKAHLKVMKSLQTKNHFALNRAFIIGDKRSLTKDLRVRFKRLHLAHLFTPSGIHFSSFYMFFIPLFTWLSKKKKYKTKKILELSLCTMPFFLNKFYSLKRISLMRIYHIFFRSIKIKVETYHIFLVSFLIDYFFGTFSKSPMSYSYSFLFLGSLLSCNRIESRLLNFLCANLLISFLTFSKVNIIGFILGFFTTALFSILFPIIFISYWLSSFLHLDLSFPFLLIIDHLTLFFSNISQYCPLVGIDFMGLIFLLIFIFKRKLRFIIFSLLFSSHALYNLPPKRLRKSENQIQVHHNSWVIYKGYEVMKQEDQKCKRIILRRGHQIRCRKTKI